MAEIISGIYKITNTITGDSYIGSSKNIKQRWAHHKCHSTWKKYSNNQLYHDMQKYGIQVFEVQILEEVEIASLKEKEQQFIEKIHPTYNNKRAKGWDFDRIKKTFKEYQKSDKYKKYQKEYMKEYMKSDKYKESHRRGNKKYKNQPCLYNGETLTLGALSTRFRRAGIEHPEKEAKKYLMNNL